MFLNFGIKHKYQAAVDALIETLTDLRALHIGQKATYLLNQREGLTNKHHYIKISDTHYKVPNALVKRYKAGSKDHHTDDYYITP